MRQQVALLVGFATFCMTQLTGCPAVIFAGGTAGAVLNAANEAAVAAFRAGRLRFIDIVPSCRAVLEQHQFDARPSLEQLLELDRWARGEVVRWACI